LAFGLGLALTPDAATAAEAKRHDAHHINPSEPSPEKPRSHVAHLDAQHRLDSTALSRAGHPVLTPARRLFRRALAFS
jgi:hypothetical protein